MNMSTREKSPVHTYFTYKYIWPQVFKLPATKCESIISNKNVLFLPTDVCNFLEEGTTSVDQRMSDSGEEVEREVDSPMFY